jgi:RND family efflux transporter MFP subunit
MSFWKQAVLCLVLVVAAAGGWYAYKNPERLGLAREEATPRARAEGSGRGNRIPGLVGGGAVNVVTAPVELDRSGDTVIAVGSAKALRSVTLYPQVTGVVTRVMFAPGQMVEADAPLLALDDEEEQIAADRARIEYAQARAAFERSEALAKSKTISSVALADAEMAAQLAENGVRTAEIAAERRTLRAPFAGIVGLTDVSTGDLVTNTTAITTLEDLSTVRVYFEVPERWAGRIKEGQALTATAQALPGSQFSGKITGIDNHVDATTRTLRLQADLANFGGLLKTGMAIMVSMEFDSNEELSVPSLAVQWDRRGSFVWKVADGVARRAEVAIIRRQSGIVVVKGEIAAGDKVAVEGLMRLREGAKINEVNEAPVIVEETPPGGGTPAAEESPAISGAGRPATRS